MMGFTKEQVEKCADVVAGEVNVSPEEAADIARAVLAELEPEWMVQPDTQQPNKIIEGLKEAITVARGEAEPYRWHTAKPDQRDEMLLDAQKTINDWHEGAVGNKALGALRQRLSDLKTSTNLEADLAEARAQIAAKDAALRRIEALTYSEGVEGDALDMATEIARAALAAPARGTE